MPYSISARPQRMQRILPKWAASILDRPEAEATVEILTPHAGKLVLIKESPDWPRRLTVTVKQGDYKCRLSFPKGDERLEMDVPRCDAPLAVTVTAANPLKRMLGRRRSYQMPERGGLRATISGSGRCGTTSITDYLDGLEFVDGTRVRARHETLSRLMLDPVRRGDVETVRELSSSFSHHIEVAPYLSLLTAAIATDKIVHLVRDGRRVVQSGMVRGWYQNDSPWNQVKPRFPGDAFAQSCHLWVHTNERMRRVAGLCVRLEDLISSARARGELLEYLGMKRTDRQFPHANMGPGSQVTGWTQHQRDTFAAICGELMDSYYPGWSQT